MNKAPRKSILPDPGNGGTVEVLNDVVKLARDAVGRFGDVTLKDGILDTSQLVEVDTIPIFPEGMEMITMDCDMAEPIIPVKFFFDGTEYIEVWFWAHDLIYVAGHQGQHLDGKKKTDEEKEQTN